MYVYTYVYLYTYIYICTCVHTDACICVYPYVCVYVCFYICACLCLFLCAWLVPSLVSLCSCVCLFQRASALGKLREQLVQHARMPRSNRQHHRHLRPPFRNRIITFLHTVSLHILAICYNSTFHLRVENQMHSHPNSLVSNPL